MPTNHFFIKIVAVSLSVLALGPLVVSDAQQVRAGEVAFYFVGRGLLNPSTGQGQVVGFLTDIKGISGPFFSGTPSEATAFFTFRSDVFSLRPLTADGDLASTIVSSGTFSVYLNSSPHGDWSNPDTFSSGQLIAKFARGETVLVQIGSISQHVLTEKLLSSHEFTFGGRDYNLTNLAPGGVTLNEFISNNPLPGVSGFPVALAFGGNSLALQEDRQ